MREESVVASDGAFIPRSPFDKVPMNGPLALRLVPPAAGLAQGERVVLHSGLACHRRACGLRASGVILRHALSLAALFLFLSPASARIGYGVPVVDDASVLWRGVWEATAGIEAGGGYKLENQKIDLLRVPTSLRYGWKDRLELGFHVPFAFQRSRSSKFDGSGLSDIAAVVKYQMSAEEGTTPASATELKLGWGPGDVVGSGGYSIGVLYSVSKTFREGLSAGHMNLGYTMYMQNRQDVFTWGFAYDRRIRDTLRGFVSVNSGNQLIPGLKKDIMLEGGLTKEFDPTSEYGFSVGTGFTEESPNFQIRTFLRKEFGRQAGVATAYKRAEFAPPPAPTAAEVVNKAEIASRTGELERSIVLYKEALERDSSIPAAWNNLGIALSKSGRPREALSAYEKASALDPRNADIYFNMGLVQYRLGDLIAARRSFARALEIDPNHTTARSNLMSLGGLTGGQ